MPKPYSQDLRERVVGHVEAGHSRRAAAAHFGVSRSLVINLMTAYRLRGSLAPKPLGGGRRAKLDPHREFLCVGKNGDITMPELAGELAAACGAKVDPASLSRWLIRNGYRFKKTLLASECDRPDIRQAREEWRTERQPKMRLEPHRLVFLDETGTTTKMTRLRKRRALRGRRLRGKRRRSKALSAIGRPKPSSPDCVATPSPRPSSSMRRWTEDSSKPMSRPNSSRPSKKATSSSWTICPPTKARSSRKPFSTAAHGFSFRRPKAPISTRSRWPSQNSRLISRARAVLTID